MKKLTVVLLLITLLVAVVGYTSVQAKDAPAFKQIYRVFSGNLPGILPAPAKDPMTGNLTATGELKKYNPATGLFEPFTGTSFSQGDCFMTGASTQTSLALTPNSSANVGPNSEFCLTEFSIDPATGQMSLQMEAAIGNFELDMNETPGTMNVALHTPVSVITGDGAGLNTKSEVTFPGTEGMTPEQLQEFISTEPIFTEKTAYENPDGSTNYGAFEPALLVDFPGIGVGTEVIEGTPELSYITPEGVVTVPLAPGQTVAFEAPPITDPNVFTTLKAVFDQISAGIEPDPDALNLISAGASPTEAPAQPTTAPVLPSPTPAATDAPQPTPQPCGDNVCDIYAGENALSCPKDCAP